MISHRPSAEIDADERVNILVVDDRRDKLLALEAILTDLGENIVCASSGKEALRCLLQQDFAVILLDVNMPGMDGFDTAALIRQRSRSELTPIIFVSAINDNENHVSRGYSLGAVDYIGTPVVPEILRAKVSVFVDLFRKTAQIRRQGEERARLIRVEAARAEAEAARERSAFLAEASNVLAASLNYEETFAALAHLLVSKLADYCFVDMVEEDGGALRQVAVAHRDPLLEEQLRGLELRNGNETDVHCGVAKVIQTGRAEVRSGVTGSDLTEFARDYHPILLDPGLVFRAYLIVPLSARGRIVGALTLVTTESRTYGPAELSLAEEVAQRAGLALDNAWLYKAAQQAREQAEQANRAKDQFLAMLSHELRTPLSPVLSTVALLETDDAIPSHLREALQMIHRNVELEARLIDDLLDLTRVSKGKLQLNIEVVDAHQLMQSALEICHQEIEQKRHRITLAMNARRHYLRADSARLQQVFWNLIKNAVKFTPEGGELTISTVDEPGEQLRVAIADNGAGLEAELVPRIFNAFEQGSRPGYGGLGLGLAITKALVQLHGGSISASSEGPEKGATFELRFPTANPPDAPTPDFQGRSGTTPRRSYRLLIVEDHADTQHSLTRLLERRGYEVRAVDGIGTAIEASQAFPFDVLISDMGLPDGTGIDLIQRLSADRRINAIALSGFGMEDDVRRSKDAGFAEHLTKPVDINKLDCVIQRIGADLPS
jgi:signal transduction histidine kinase/DNA-binding response OmpR family regulator